MLSALKKFLSKLFPKKLATEVTAELPTPTPVQQDLAPIDQTPVEYELTVQQAEAPSEAPVQLFTDPAPGPLASFEVKDVIAELPVEESKPVRARNKGKFAPDDKFTEEYNEAWVGGKSPAKKSAKKKKKR